LSPLGISNTLLNSLNRFLLLLNLGLNNRVIINIVDGNVCGTHTESLDGRVLLTINPIGSAFLELGTYYIHSLLLSANRIVGFNLLVFGTINTVDNLIGNIVNEVRSLLRVALSATHKRTAHIHSLIHYLTNKFVIDCRHRMVVHMERKHLVWIGWQSITHRSADVAMSSVVKPHLDAFINLFAFVFFDAEPKLGTALITSDGTKILPVNTWSVPHM